MADTSSHKHVCKESCVFRRVYLTRYALTHERNTAFDAVGTLKKEGGLVTAIKSSGPMWNFFYTLRVLRPAGWVYVYEEDLQILKSHNLPEAYGEDLEPFYLEIHEDEPYVYIAYSETEWPKGYWEKMRADGSYKNRMQRIDLVNSGARHTAPVEQYAELVEEFRERPGKLLSLRYLMEDPVFEPVSLDYDERLNISSDSKAQVVGERWQSSANPFGNYEKDFYLPKKVQKKYFPLPASSRPDAAASPAPVLAALVDPLGEGFDLAAIHSTNLEDVMLYTGYYGYTYVLGKIFANLEKETARLVEKPGGSDATHKYPLYNCPEYVYSSTVEQVIPEKPWVTFLQAQDAMRDEFQKLLREYIACWRQWLLAQDALHTFFWALQDFQYEGADSEIVITGRQAFVFCHAHIDRMLPDAENLHALFADQTWTSFFKFFLNPETPCDENANMLISLLAKVCQTSSIKAHKALLDHATEFIRRQKNVKAYRGDSRTVQEFMSHTLVFPDLDDEQEGDEGDESDLDDMARELAGAQKTLQWDVPSVIASLYEHNPPSLAGVSVFDIADHIKTPSLCNAISTVNYLNMILGNVIGFSSGFKTFVEGIKKKDDGKIVSGALGGVAAIADYAAFRIMQNGSLPYFAKFPSPKNAGKIWVASLPKGVVSVPGMMAASRVLIVTLAKPLLVAAWVLTCVGDCKEIWKDWQKERTDAAILGAIGVIGGAFAMFAGSLPGLVVGLLVALAAFSLRGVINNEYAFKDLVRESYWSRNRGKIAPFSFRNFLSKAHSYYAPFETLPEDMNVARYADIIHIFHDVTPVSISFHFQSGHPELSIPEAASSKIPYKSFIGLNNYTRVEIILNKIFVSLDQAQIIIKEKWNDEEKYYEHKLIKPYLYQPSVSDKKDSITCELWVDEISLMLENLCSKPRINSGKYLSFTIQVVYKNAVTNQMDECEKTYHFIRPDFVTPDYVEKVRSDFRAEVR